MEVLDSLPFALDAGPILQKLSPSTHAAFAGTLDELTGIVKRLARPKAIFLPSTLVHEDGDWVSVGGVRFSGLPLQLSNSRGIKAFPFIATCGRELDAVTVSAQDVMRHYCLNLIKTSVLESAVDWLRAHIAGKYQARGLAKVSPGSATFLPMERQKELFLLFGGGAAEIGVTLTDNLVMVPLVSESGLYIETERDIEDCELCGLEKCSCRKRPMSTCLR